MAKKEPYAIETAIGWIAATDRTAIPGPIVLALKDRFGLSTIEAADALRARAF